MKYDRERMFIAYEKSTDRIYDVSEMKLCRDTIKFNIGTRAELVWSGYNLTSDKFILMKNTGFADTTGTFLFENDIVQMNNEFYLIRFAKNSINTIEFVDIEKNIKHIDLPISTKYVMLSPANVYQGNLFGNREFIISFFKDTTYNYRVNFADKIGLTDGELEIINDTINNHFKTLPALNSVDLPEGYSFVCPACGERLEIKDNKAFCCGLEYIFKSKMYVEDSSYSLTALEDIANDIVSEDKKEEKNSDFSFDKEFGYKIINYLIHNHDCNTKKGDNFSVYADRLFEEITYIKYNTLSENQCKSLSASLRKAKTMIDKKYEIILKKTMAKNGIYLVTIKYREED